MSPEEKLARSRGHRDNIHRYRRLLETYLSDLERAYVERRISAELAALDMLAREGCYPRPNIAASAAAQVPAIPA
ncbi:hypothetical protein [Bradyrhizobium sp. Ce-3]|uniref:hypothetical protein n=1 Tax=Bradyrhizobium sp. Ce-3 TaxID=2913970 RepID=UPI001FC89499|nr:hypothetical protein [Bradyrhizobium sp. Ce-3]GKQ55697.1 hypothetical protein BRSPCE3_65520 [Bradyrhizobium sp. Ce-3]